MRASAFSMRQEMGLEILLSNLVNRIRAHRPAVLELGDNKQAAVALMLRHSPENIEVLVIERARHDNDPWSGQMALPGGRVETFDADARSAAERESLEEVGVDLSKAEYLGRLDDQQGRHRGHPGGIVVTGCVYIVDSATEPRPNYEVRDIVWVSLHRFLDAGNYTQVDHPVYPGEMFPGIRISDKNHQVVWGLTRRFMASFFSTIHVPFEG